MIHIDSDVEDLIEGIINDLIGEVQHMDSSLHLNERYLHHLFTHMIQSRGILVSLNKKDYCNTYLHPEWATEKAGALYKYIKEAQMGEKACQYIVDDNGHSGFIDFVVEAGDNLKYAIEFKMSQNLNREGIIFDYMKLLDHKSNFTKSYSLVVYHGHERRSSHFNNENALTISSCLKIAKKKVRRHNPRYHFYAVEFLNVNTFFLFVSEDDGLFIPK